MDFRILLIQRTADLSNILAQIVYFAFNLFDRRILLQICKFGRIGGFVIPLFNPPLSTGTPPEQRNTTGTAKQNQNSGNL